MDVRGHVFAHDHYVPILRWKAGEKRALKDLLSRDKARLTPLLAWSRPGEVAPEEDRVIATPQPRDLARDVLKHWGARPFFWDPHWLWAGDLGHDSKALRLYAREMIGVGLRAIPVLHLSDSHEYQEALRQLISGDGICLRLAHAEVIEPSVADRLTTILGATRLTPAMIHLVADFEAHTRDVDIPILCERLPEVLRYRTFTVAAGSFPVDLREHKGPQVFYLPREEWLRWQDQVAHDLRRRPAFGDYGTLNPTLTPAKGGLNPSATIRYTTEDHWLVMKGEGLRNEDGPGYEQYRGNAALLMQRRDYCGPEFSAGDSYVRDVATSHTGTGNPTTWVQAAVNHHIRFAVRQIAELFGGAPTRPRSPRKRRGKQQGILRSKDPTSPDATMHNVGEKPA